MFTIGCETLVRQLCDWSGHKTLIVQIKHNLKDKKKTKDEEHISNYSENYNSIINKSKVLQVTLIHYMYNCIFECVGLKRKKFNLAYGYCSCPVRF